MSGYRRPEGDIWGSGIFDNTAGDRVAQLATQNPDDPSVLVTVYERRESPAAVVAAAAVLVGFKLNYFHGAKVELPHRLQSLVDRWRSEPPKERRRWPNSHRQSEFSLYADDIRTLRAALEWALLDEAWKKQWDDEDAYQAWLAEGMALRYPLYQAMSMKKITTPPLRRPFMDRLARSFLRRSLPSVRPRPRTRQGSGAK